MMKTTTVNPNLFPISMALLLPLVGGLAACAKEEPKSALDKAKDAIEETSEDAANAVENAAEAVGETAEDAADAVKEAVEEAKD
jgi:hypothetical protein